MVSSSADQAQARKQDFKSIHKKLGEQTHMWMNTANIVLIIQLGNVHVLNPATAKCSQFIHVIKTMMAITILKTHFYLLFSRMIYGKPADVERINRRKVQACNEVYEFKE